jgi:hypothetical protein
MCLDTGPAAPLAAGAPVNDNRCYVYGAVSGQVRTMGVHITAARCGCVACWHGGNAWGWQVSGGTLGSAVESSCSIDSTLKPAQASC